MTYRSLQGLLGLACTIVALTTFGLGEAAAAALPSTSLGANVNLWYLNGQYAPTDLSLGSGVGVGLVRLQAIDGTNMDGVVQWLAQSHMRLYPILGLPCPSGTKNCTPQTQIPPATAASEMAKYVPAFAQRYGPNGTFWAANPKLPYLPVQSFEIGNEPNVRVEWVQDGTHLHWDNPSNPGVADDPDYAQVYAAARTALHKVDPSGKAVVGGLADSASGGVDLSSDEAALAALPGGSVDAVGYHPWVYDVSDSLLEPDTSDLRTWMNKNGYSAVPLDVNEFGACWEKSSTTDSQGCPVTQTSSTWGSAVATYTKWALCTPSLGVENVQPFVWGGTPVTDEDLWLPLVSSNGSETAYGQDFLGVAKTLTTTGCPRSAAAKPKSGSKSSAKPGLRSGARSGTGGNLASMTLRIARLRKHGRRVNLTVRHARGAGTVTVTVTRGKHGHRRMRGHKRNPTTNTFSARLPAGRWTVTVTGRPARGYARPRPIRRRVAIATRAG